jgi:hypothetical protein
MNGKGRQIAGTVFIIVLSGMLLYLMIGVRSYESFVDAGRCGVDLPSCVGKDIRCMNGYCKSDIPPRLPPLSDLPMTPPTRY